MNIERICDKLPVKYGWANLQTETNNTNEEEKQLYVNIQYKGTCKTSGKYGNK